MDQTKGLIGNLEKKGEVIQAKIRQKFERKLGSPMRRLLSNEQKTVRCTPLSRQWSECIKRSMRHILCVARIVAGR